MKPTLRIATAGLAALAALSPVPALAQQGSETMTPPGERMPERMPEQTPPRDMPSGGETPSTTPTTPAMPGTPAPPGGDAASTPPPAGGAAADAAAFTTDASQTLAANVVAADRLATLESAVVAAGLAEALGGEGPFTVFAPDDAAFGLVRPDALQALMQPANRSQLENVLKAHVVAGRVTAAELAAQIQAGGGSATLETIGGDRLTASMEGPVVVITGANNSRAFVTQADGNASNGVIHVINGVLLPAD